MSTSVRNALACSDEDFKIFTAGHVEELLSEVHRLQDEVMNLRRVIKTMHNAVATTHEEYRAEVTDEDIIGRL